MRLRLKQVSPDLLGLEEHVLDEGDLAGLLGTFLPRRLHARRGGLVLHLLEQVQRVLAHQQGDHHHDDGAGAAHGHADGQAPLILDIFAFAAFLPTHRSCLLGFLCQFPAPRKTRSPDR